MSDREAMKLALSVLKGYANYPHSTKRVSMLEHARGVTIEAITALEKALAAPEKRHPGYVVGNHWLETAYERLCAGESEDAILEDYELVREPRLRDLRLDSERYRWVLERAWFQFEFDGRYGDSGETVQQLDAAVGEAMDASTAPAAAPEPATEPAIRARGEVPQ